MGNQRSSRGQDSSNFDQVITDGQSPTQLEQNISVRGPGYSVGPGGGGWTTLYGIIQNMFAWRRGITQLFGGNLQKFAVGDSVVMYGYNKSYGGATAGSDEGSGIISGKRTPPTTYFHGTVASTSGTGDQAPVLTFTTGNNVMIDGGFLLNITKATVSGSLNGASSILSLETFSGIAPTYLKKLPVTGVSLPTTTAAGVATAAITNSGVLGNAPVSKTITVNLVKIGGVFPVFAINDIVTVAGSNFVEQSKITAASVASGTQQQTISLALRYPNTAAILFRGGIQGTAISFNANLALSGIRSSYPAVGSMTGTDLIFAFSALGDTTNPDIPQVGAEAATTSGASAAFLLCPYAEVVDNLTLVGTSTLEQNRVAWATSDVVENPPNPAQLDSGVFWDVLFQYPQVIAGSPTARFLFVNGPAFGGPSASANWIRSNNSGSLYQGGGGPLIAPVLNKYDGTYGEAHAHGITPDNGRYYIKIYNNYTAGANFNFIDLDYVGNGTITFNHTNQRWVLPRIDITQYFVGGVAGIDATPGGLTFNKGLLTAATSGSVAAISSANPSTLNVTTAGTRDWMVPNGTSTLPSQISAGGLHVKVSGQTGGMLVSSFAWVAGGQSVTTFTQNFTIPAISNTASDDCATSGMSSAIGGQGVFSSGGGATGFGFKLAVPADTTSRTLKVYASVFSGTATITATLSDGSASPATATIVSIAATTQEGFYTVTYNAASGGQILTVTVLLTTNLGSSPNVKFMAATLA